MRKNKAKEKLVISLIVREGNPQTQKTPRVPDYVP